MRGGPGGGCGCDLSVLACSATYLMLMLRIMPLAGSCDFLDEMLLLPKTFQNRSVSSAAAETTVEPSGLWAMWSTRAV